MFKTHKHNFIKICKVYLKTSLNKKYKIAVKKTALFQPKTNHSLRFIIIYHSKSSKTFLFQAV